MNNQSSYKFRHVQYTKKDILILFILSICVWLLAAASLGFFSAGFDCICQYDGKDDIAFISHIKELLQEKWIWNTNRLGAPYSRQMLGFPAICLQLPEMLMMKFWGLFTKSVPLVINLQFLFTFVLCAIVAYLVFRKMNLGYSISIFGAVLFCFNPYIYERGIEHYCLTACYFVPVSIYFCYRCYFDDDFLKGRFFSKNTIIVLLMCACIAGNGIGYYPFFTCFELLVVAVCKWMRTKNWKAMFPALKVIGMICGCLVILLLPAIHYKFVAGANSSFVRNPEDVEVYALKIVQLFIPTNGNAIPFINGFADRYNQNMPFVNENVSSYLGILGCLGFLLGLLYMFGFRKESPLWERISPFAKMNLATVLVMSVGGFISLFAIITEIYLLRSVNRISIYISFCSISIICILLQDAISVAGQKYKLKQSLIYCVLGAIMLLAICDQTPQLVSYGIGLQSNKELWENDENFISQIEAQLNEGDMVYQLPYHKFPEGGSENSMRDYQLLTGYIHSDTLKWSYGSLKGTEGDKWNETVSKLDCDEMIDTLISTGFKGIYVDNRAYKNRDLINSIADILGYKPIKSKDNYICFFNLYPYIEQMGR